MSNTISEGEIVIKDELPEVEPIKIEQVPVKIEENEETKEIVVSIMDNKVERFEISTLDQEEAEPNKIHNLRPKRQNPFTVKPEPKVKKEILAYKDTETNTYHCDKCDRTFKGESYLRRHQQNHETNKIFACPKCDKAFKTKFHLKRHQLMHGKQANYSCKICGKTFKTPQSLYQHSFIHSETRDFQCDLCEKSFKSSSNLTQHKYSHVEEKAFACSICCKAFKKRAVMKIHELSHTEERPFICPDCGFAFKLKSQMQAHQKKSCKVLNHNPEVHDKEHCYENEDQLMEQGLLVCLECGAIFKEKFQLKAHRAECLKYIQYRNKLDESRKYK
jgi:uncharacterized Zn-finger protein